MTYYDLLFTKKRRAIPGLIPEPKNRRLKKPVKFEWDVPQTPIEKPDLIPA